MGAQGLNSGDNKALNRKGLGKGFKLKRGGILLSRIHINAINKIQCDIAAFLN